MKTIFTPVGVSLITNYKDDTDPSRTKLVQSILTPTSFERLSSEEKESISSSLSAFLRAASTSCAERTSLDAIHKELKEDIEVVFLLSDTHIADFLGTILCHYYPNSTKYPIVGLQIEDKERFESEGLHNFFTFFKATTKDKELIFNITTGYKAFTQYLTIVGSIYNIPIKYIFERSEHLMSMPVLPIGFDDQVADLYAPYLNNWILNHVSIPPKVVEKLLYYGFITHKEGTYTLTALGVLFKDKTHHKSSSFGDLMEHLLLSIYIQDPTVNIQKSHKYQLQDGKKGDIDILITSKDGTEVELIEVKSFGQWDKFQEQLPKYIQYLQQNHAQVEKKRISVLFYLLESDLLKIHQTAFETRSQECQQEGIHFSVRYIEIQPENFQNFLRTFKKKEIHTFF